MNAEVSGARPPDDGEDRLLARLEYVYGDGHWRATAYGEGEHWTASFEACEAGRRWVWERVGGAVVSVVAE